MANTPEGDGPSLQQYVETRFNLLSETIKERQLTTDAAIDALRAHVDTLDRLYVERDASRAKAIDAALIAAKEQTTAAFVASKDAISEAKKSQDAYNLSHNDLLRKMERQSAETMQRGQADVQFKALDEKIADLKGVVGGTAGAVRGVRALKEEGRANIALLISGVGFVVMLGSALIGVVLWIMAHAGAVP